MYALNRGGKVQRLNLNDDGTLSIRLSDGYTPVKYKSFTIPLDEGDTVSSRLRTLFDRLASGDWIMNQSSNSMLYYHFLQAIDEVERRQLLTILYGRSRFDGEHYCSGDKLEVHYDAVLRAFQKRWLGQDTPNIKEKAYAVRLEDGRWIHKRTPNGYNYSNTEPRRFPLIQAIMIQRYFSGELHHLDAE